MMIDFWNPLVRIDTQDIRTMIAEPGRRYNAEPRPGQEAPVTRAGLFELRCGFRFSTTDPYATPEWLSFGFRQLDLTHELFEGTRLHILREPLPLLYCFAIGDVCLVNRDSLARQTIQEWWDQRPNRVGLGQFDGPLITDHAQPMQQPPHEVEIYPKRKRGLDV